MKAIGILLGLGAAAGGYYLYQHEKDKQASTAPTPGAPVPVFGPDGAIIGYATPTGIYPNQAPGAPRYSPPSAAGLISTAGCLACGSHKRRRRADGRIDCDGCESDRARMQHLTSSVALAGAFR